MPTKVRHKGKTPADDILDSAIMVHTLDICYLQHLIHYYVFTQSGPFCSLCSIQTEDPSASCLAKSTAKASNSIRSSESVDRIWQSPQCYRGRQNERYQTTLFHFVSLTHSLIHTLSLSLALSLVHSFTQSQKPLSPKNSIKPIQNDLTEATRGYTPGCQSITAGVRVGIRVGIRVQARVQYYYTYCPVTTTHLNQTVFSTQIDRHPSIHAQHLPSPKAPPSSSPSLYLSLSFCLLHPNP